MWFNRAGGESQEAGFFFCTKEDLCEKAIAFEAGAVNRDGLSRSDRKWIVCSRVGGPASRYRQHLLGDEGVRSSHISVIDGLMVMPTSSAAVGVGQ